MIVAGFAGGDGLWHALRSSNAPISAAATTLCGRVTYAAGRDWEGNLPSHLRCADCCRLSGLDIDQPEPPATPPSGALARQALQEQAVREAYALPGAPRPLEDLLDQVWSCEREWRLDDRLAVAGRLS